MYLYLSSVQFVYAMNNSHTCDAIPFRKLVEVPLSRCMEPDGFLNLCFGDLMPWGSISLKTTSLADHVLHVVRMRANRKVVWSYARGSIARVEYEQSVFRPGGIMRQEPTDDVSTHVSRSIRRGAEVPIAIQSVYGSHPHPTACGAGSAMVTESNFLPETGDKGFMGMRCACQVVASRRAVFPDSSLMRNNLKRLATRDIGTQQRDRLLCHALLTCASTTLWRAIPHAVFIPRRDLKRVATRGQGTEQLDAWLTMSRHQMTSLLGQRCGLGSVVDKDHARLTSGDQPLPNLMSIADFLMERKDT